jgi:flagellar hook assembly protein FlgD
VQSTVTYSEKLPKERVYNWPNPVYDTKTFIRYFINGNASSVNIRILDLSGELVTKLVGTTFPNNDNEVIWDVSKVSSGLYYGVVEATIDGSVETKVIKIAVVK